MPKLLLLCALLSPFVGDGKEPEPQSECLFFNVKQVIGHDVDYFLTKIVLAPDQRYIASRWYEGGDSNKGYQPWHRGKWIPFGKKIVLAPDCGELEELIYDESGQWPEVVRVDRLQIVKHGKKLYGKLRSLTSDGDVIKLTIRGKPALENEQF